MFEHMDVLMLLLDELVDGGYEKSHDTVFHCFFSIVMETDPAVLLHRIAVKVCVRFEFVFILSFVFRVMKVVSQNNQWQM